MRRRRRGAGRGHVTCGSAASARPPRSTASSARWPTCSRSTPSPRCPPATSPPPRSRARRGWPPRSCTSCAGWPATAARRARSAASTSTPARAAASSAWSTRTSSRSARCAGCPTPTTCSPPAPAATSWASTPSRRAARSRGRWSASSADCIDAPWLRFGDGAALLRALDADRRASTGARRAARPGVAPRGRDRSGGGSIDFAPQVKGLELPGYEPRTLQAMALGLAVNSRGADHNRSGAYEADLSGELDRLDGGTRPRRGRRSAPRTAPR